MTESAAMRIIFMGTPDFSVPPLQSLLAAGHNVVAVYTQPPKPSGRGKKMRLSAVHTVADEHGLTVETPHNFKDPSVIEQFAHYQPDVVVVVAYGVILPKTVLDYCPCYNIHASLLPKWRGAAPIQRAMMAGDAVTGITIMHMDEGIDTGDMLLKGEIPIDEASNAGDLHDALSDLGAALVVEAIKQFQQGNVQAIKQDSVDEAPSYAAKLTKGEEHINWHQPARDIYNHIRAFSPKPGVYFEYGEEKVKIYKSQLLEEKVTIGQPGEVLDDQLTIATSQGCIRPLLVQRQGKKTMAVDDLLRGFVIEKGTLLR